MRIRARGSLTPMIALLVALGIGQAIGCMDRDELQCEEAAARIRDCCPGVDVAKINCEFIETSCGPIVADIDPDRARCIRRASCATLETAGVCAWAATANGPAPRICP